MKLIIPEDKKRLERLFKPYLDGMKLKDDAPEEAKKRLKNIIHGSKKKLNINISIY